MKKHCRSFFTHRFKLLLQVTVDNKKAEIIISNQVEIIASLRVVLAGIADLQSRASDIPEKNIRALQQKMVHREALVVWDEIQGK